MALRKASLGLLPRLSWLGALDNAGSSFMHACRGFADQADLKKTPLHDFHVEQGGMLHSREFWGDIG